MKTNSFKDLIVWRKSYALALVVYRVTGGFPKSETYGLYITENPEIEQLLREVGSMLYRMLHPLNAKR